MLKTSRGLERWGTSISWEEEVTGLVEVMNLLEVMGLNVDSMVYMVMGLLFRKMPELKE